MRTVLFPALCCLVLVGCAASPISPRAAAPAVSDPMQAPPASAATDPVTAADVRGVVRAHPVGSSGQAWTTDAYVGRGICASGGCPPVARLRPSEGWAYRDAVLTRPPRDADEAWLDKCCACLRNRNSKRLALIAPLGMLGYGLIFWQYGSGKFGVKNEGWFGKNTSHGGADKTGHFVAGTIWTATMAGMHRHWGFTQKEAAKRGALIGFGALAAIELADGSSNRQGFSWSDLVMDAGGCIVGYLHETSPWVNRVLDFRWEWFPTEEPTKGTDLTSDYENSSHLMAINVGGLLSRRPSNWDLLDVQIGLRARDYKAVGSKRERWVFAGVGLNVANLLRRYNFRYAAVFDYIQLPFVSLRVGYEVTSQKTMFMWAP